MTDYMAQYSRGTIVPESCVNQSLAKLEGAGKTGCYDRTRSLVCEVERRKHTS